LTTKPSDSSGSHVSDDEIVIECDLPAAPAKVWRSLTVPELLDAWLLTDDLGTRVADAVAPPDAPGTRRSAGSDTHLELLDAEPPRTLRYRWSTYHWDGAREQLRESVLSFELTPTAGGTHLRVLHGSFRETTTLRMLGRSTLGAAPLLPGHKPPMALACQPGAPALWQGSTLRRAA
jgi:uncharacterized protein YndB with AHSA1/START domain